jgi:HD-like signal output (HDOD) protein
MDKGVIACSIASIDDVCIPTIPESVLGFMQLVDNENTSIAELAAFIGQDPALTATVLSFANSPSLRDRGTSKDLVHILISIGTRMVRTLATCLVVKNVFSPSYDSQEFDFTG